MVKALEAGVDQFGGENIPDVARESGEVVATPEDADFAILRLATP